jgi:glucose-6-phosphate 1-dehydrogenase
MSPHKFNIPTVFVIFGATGDLAQKKIFPALYNLYKTKQLPEKFKIIGTARRTVSDDAFKTFITKIITDFEGAAPDSKFLKPFLEDCSYHQAQFGSLEEYKAIAKVLGMNDMGWSICSNKLFYLAVPPEQYELILNNLVDSGLTDPCSPEEGWTRVLIEKPFGKDATTANKIDTLLGKLFKEEQIYRIDHYLAKEMIQNILAFRFANNLLEESWNNKFIEKIEVRIHETGGVEKRGAFYDGIGALRDVGQNHLLQMLALVTMDRPTSLTGEPVRKKRRELLQKLIVHDLDGIKKYTFRGQYEGYKSIEGVKKDTSTETYFKVKAFLDSPRWQGVPIILESGKRLPSVCNEVVISFKEVLPKPLASELKGKRNMVAFRITPKEEIHISFIAKKPGLKMELQERNLNFIYRTDNTQNKKAEDYERILMDCIKGDQMLFVTTKEVEAMWKFIDPVICAWDENQVPLNTYTPDSDEVLTKSCDVEEAGVSTMPREIGVIGLGKMGAGVALQLIEKGWKVHGYNRTTSVTHEYEKQGLYATQTLQQLVEALPKPRVLWIMVPAGKAVDEVIFGTEGVAAYLEKGDIVIDAGNSLYKDAKIRADKLKEKGIHFMDVGTSGGPGGARYGACLMIGGEKETFDYLLPLFTDIALPEGFGYFGKHGAGHFVKMVHNGIEYGMMQALAEGFAIMKKSEFNLDLTKVADLYNHGSVIESSLVGWIKQGYEIFGQELKDISDKINHSGEGAWTVDAGKELDIPAPIIEGSLQFRIDSEIKPAYTNKVINLQRTMFGGHAVKKE